MKTKILCTFNSLYLTQLVNTSNISSTLSVWEAKSDCPVNHVAWFSLHWALQWLADPATWHSLISQTNNRLFWDCQVTRSAVHTWLHSVDWSKALLQTKIVKDFYTALASWIWYVMCSILFIFRWQEKIPKTKINMKYEVLLLVKQTRDQWSGRGRSWLVSR